MENCFSLNCVCQSVCLSDKLSQVSKSVGVLLQMSLDDRAAAAFHLEGLTYEYNIWPIFHFSIILFASSFFLLSSFSHQYENTYKYLLISIMHYSYFFAFLLVSCCIASSAVAFISSQTITITQKSSCVQNNNRHRTFAFGIMAMAHSLDKKNAEEDPRQQQQQNIPALLYGGRPRRDFLSHFGIVATAVAVAVEVIPPPIVCWAADKQERVFQPGEKLGTDAAKERFQLARQEIHYLIDNYTEIQKGGGDAVRRYLGTVGVTSGMFGIGRVLKELRQDSDDIVEYTEAMDEFNAYLYQAEGAAYQSLFIEHSSAKGTPEAFLATAKQDVLSMAKYMDLLAAQLSL
jgi:hypothetical protein